jgi:Skp family chaperone for outer membrane proteins
MRYLILLFCFLAAQTATARNFTVATVDMQKLFKEYPGTLPAQNKFETLTQSRKKDLVDSEKILENLKEELTGPRADDLTTAEKTEKGKEYDEKRQDLLDLQSRIQNELAQKEQEMTQAIVGKIKMIVAAIAQKHDVDLVLDTKDTESLQSGLDLTDEVLAGFKNVDSGTAGPSDKP